MNIQEIDKWLKDQYGISYTEMSNEFNSASEMLSKKYKEIERLNKELEFEKSKNKEVREYIERNKQKTIPAYGDNFDDDFDIALDEEDIDNILGILDKVDKENK